MLSNYAVALEVLAGKWGNGVERRNRLTDAGYNYMDVQSIVNALVKDGVTAPPATELEKLENTEPELPVFEIDFDPQKHSGIQVNVIV